MKKYKVLAMFDEAEIDNKKTRAIIALVEDEVEEKVDKVLLELKSMNQKFDARFDALETKINVLKYAAFALFLPIAYFIIKDIIITVSN